MKASTDLILLKNITKKYHLGDNRDYLALQGISLIIRAGEFISIMGPSGSGKSTLMHILGALDNATSGQYFFKAKDITSYSSNDLAKIRNQEIGFVFQAFNLLPRTTVFKNVERPLLYSMVPKTERRDRVLRALDLVGLSDKAQNYSNQLSGGEIQRVAIARALIMNPSIILADEPTGNLDSKTSKEIMALLTKLHQQGRTVVVITHDPEIARYAKRLISLKDGQIISDKNRHGSS